MAGPASVGVYVHVPFCERVCPYCDFAVVAAPKLGRADEDRYIEALLRELELRAPVFSGRSLASLYFGGGTPSLLRPESLAKLTDAVRGAFAGAGAEVKVKTEVESQITPRLAPEITLEVNPSTVERERLLGFRTEAGVNRLSIGVQTFDDSLLKALGRAHRAAESFETLSAARAAGFENVSLDLMFAALHQTPQMLERDLEQVVAFAPEHVSTYELVLEERTPFGRAAALGRLQPYPSDGGADMLGRIRDRLGNAGILQYELTNHARSGFASAHNGRYWAREPVLALGVGAHSSDPKAPGRLFGARPANPRGLPEYLERVAAGGPVATSEDVATEAQARAEALFLGLRRAVGVEAAAFEREFGGPPRRFFSDEISALAERGLLLEAAAGDLRLSERGQMLADIVFESFV